MKEEALRLAEALTIPLAGKYIATDDIKKAGQMIYKLLGDRQVSDISETLSERQKTHGSFETHARISQELKTVIYLTDEYHSLSPQQAEALDMIAHKIARILNGNPNIHDHWHDIAGYATLVANTLEKK
jgi:hypothetical protein